MNYKDNDEHLELDELDTRFQECASVLRGNVDRGRYKDFVLPLIFYAAVNDWFNRELDSIAQQKEGTDFDQLPEQKQQFLRTTAEEEFGISIPEDHTWTELTSETDNIAVKIDTYFTEFEDANSEQYNSIFNNKFKTIQSFTGEEGDRLLTRLLNKIDAIDFSAIPPDMMGEAYMRMMRRYSQPDAGEYFTPVSLIDTMVQVLEPFEEGSTFHDPAAGSASMLVETGQQIRKQLQGEFDDRDELEDYINRNFEFTGQEINPTISGTAKMNLALHALEGRIERGDSISTPRFTDGAGERRSFDYIISNPPFGTETPEKYSQRADSKIESNFLLMIMDILNEDGEAAVVVPEGLLFDSSKSAVRERLLNEFNLQMILSLPENTFHPYAGVDANVLFFENDGSQTDEFWFYDARSEFENIKEENPLSFEKHFEEFIGSLDSREDNDRFFEVSRDEVDDDNYELHLKKYKEFKYDGHRPPEEIAQDIKEELATIETELDQMVGENDD